MILQRFPFFYFACSLTFRLSRVFSSGGIVFKSLESTRHAVFILYLKLFLFACFEDCERNMRIVNAQPTLLFNGTVSEVILPRRPKIIEFIFSSLPFLLLAFYFISFHFKDCFF